MTRRTLAYGTAMVGAAVSPVFLTPWPLFQGMAHSQLRHTNLSHSRYLTRPTRSCRQSHGDADALQFALRIRGAHCANKFLQDVSLELRPGNVAILVGTSGAGKTSLLRLLASEQPSAAEAFDVNAPRPVAIVDRDTLQGAAELTKAEKAALTSTWGVGRMMSTRTARVKQHCLAALRQSSGRGLLLLDEVLEVLSSPLRRAFALDLKAASRQSGFAVVSATHCLAGDVGWLTSAADEAWILDAGRLTRVLDFCSLANVAAFKEYAALRCRLGTVNS